MAFRFTSPLLQAKDQVLSECPVSAVLREMPYAYDAIALHGSIETGAINPVEQSPWAQAALRVIGYEKSRLWDISQQTRRAASDAAYGERVRSGRGR